MTPILYAPTETEFTNNGIGPLSDTISCKVTQQRNGMYEAELLYPVFSGVLASEIKMRSIILVLPDNLSKPQPMRVYYISKPKNGIITINCRHVAYDLAGIVTEPFFSPSVQMAFMLMKSLAVTDCPFSFYTDKTTTAWMDVSEPKSIWSLLGGEEGSILDVYGGGEYEFDRWMVYLHNERGYDRGVEIRYGKNLIDLTQEQNCESVYTGVYPYWKDADGLIYQLPEKVINVSGNYDYTRIYPLDLSDQWEEEPTDKQLRDRAKKYISDNNIGVPKVSITVSFVALDQTEEYKNLAALEQVGLCDTVHVYFEKLGISATAKVQEVVFDSLAERYTSVTLGDASSSLASVVAAQGQSLKKKPSQTAVKSAIATLTSNILGANGGYVRFIDTNNDGQLDTLYIADHENPEYAQKVWRFNYEGWGASSNGFNGPFTIGASLDKGIVANFITAGVLDAALIKAGLLQDASGKNHWDMSTGEFALASTTTVGGNTVSSIAQAAVNAQTQQFIFNKLTNNGQSHGIFLRDGYLYINGNYIDTFNLTTVNASLTNELRCYSGSALGGYLGFMNGSTGSGLTNGIGVCDATGNNYFIATSAGARMNGRTLNGNASSSVGCYGGNVTLTPHSNGQVTVNGNFVVTGTKSREVETSNYLDRLLYSYEMPSPMFGDIGEGIIDENGECIIDLDDIFSECINPNVEYQVFLQKEGQGDVWVYDKNYSFLTVHGTPGLKFAWEIKVKQMNYELTRLEESSSDEEEPMDIGYYEQLYYDDISDFDSLYEDDLIA